MDTITLETTIAYPAKRRTVKLSGADEQETLLIFTIPTHSELLPYLPAKFPQAVSCYYRNLKFKYGTLTANTPIRLTANIERGKRGGLTLHIRELELTGPTVPDLTKVNANMLNKWTKNINNQHDKTGSN